MQDEHVRGKYTNYYNDVARWPTTSKYRRFGAQWTKLLNDGVNEVIRREAALDAELGRKGAASDMFLTTVLDCPRRLVGEDRALKKQWEDYEESLRRYTQDLCLVAQMYSLKDQHPFYGKRLAAYDKLFHNNRYGPTGESAAIYQGTASPDFCVTLGVPSSDIFTNLYIRYSGDIEKHILRRLRTLFGRHNKVPGPGAQTAVQFNTIVSAMDYLTCFLVPILFTAIMFVLVAIRPYRIRIAVGGGFGLVLAFLAKVVTGKVSRGDLFAYTAAYFAVASVYIGSTGDIVSGGD